MHLRFLIPRLFKNSAASCPAANSLSTEVRSIYNSSSDDLPLIAYRVRGGGPEIDVAESGRSWMSKTPSGFANRCLPLRIANQAGWFIRSHEEIEVVWDGGIAVNCLTLTKGTLDDTFLSSHFGHGILTWKLPYLFRTPPGYNLYVRGPANWCKDGATPLDGIVESDWAISTFTMNWKITRPSYPIRFAKGEPICMIFPIARGQLDRFTPEIRPIAEVPALESQFGEWRQSRNEFNAQSRRSASMHDWQKHYYLGRTIRGDAFPDHQTHLKLKRFRIVE